MSLMNFQPKKSSIKSLNLKKNSNQSILTGNNISFWNDDYYDDNYTNKEVDEFCKKYNIPDRYFGVIKELYIELNDTIRPKSVLKEWVGEKIKLWKNDPYMSIAQIFNRILNNSNIGLEFNFSDEFIEENYEWLIDSFLKFDMEDGEPVVKFKLFDNNEDASINDKLSDLIFLIRKIKNCEIEYDEMEKQIPGLTDYIFDNLNIDGIVKDREVLANLWNSIAFYSSNHNRIGVIEDSKYPMVYEALLDFYPELPDKIVDMFDSKGIDITKKDAKRILRILIRKCMRYGNAFVDDLFDLMETIENEDWYSIMKELDEFEELYDVDVGDLGIDVHSVIFDEIKGHVVRKTIDTLIDLLYK